MDFKDAWNIAVAEITPQPWDYTTSDGTLTVIPAGLRASKDEAEVVIRVNETEEWVKTPDVQHLIDALTAGESWTSVWSGWGTEVTVADGGVTVAVWEHGVAASVTLPPEQRLPLASAFARAYDVARAWEG
ncbi:hypothetical protein GCM10009601_51590 [Streptomyces thermospinosisporus]|uniref:YbjN domain-containing protein n=1 Tax=Streptomyces thermospinosisporus TaxID=161482 RepID=A0ABN1Z4R4_9ACTN